MALSDKITDPSTKTPLEIGFTAYEVFRRQWSGVNTYELINAALARLEEAGWIRSIVDPPSKVEAGRRSAMKSTPKSSTVVMHGKRPNKSKKWGFRRRG